MKAWLLRRFENPFKLEIADVSVPEPGAGQIRIRNMAAGLAFGDTVIFDGTYQKKPPLPYIPSNEWSGVVDKCGLGVTRFKPGDKVMVFSAELSGGGLAEYSVAPERFVVPCPPRLSFADAATSLMNYWTSFHALVRRGALRAGETLVVHGASGGVGSTAVEIGRALDAVVIATGGNDERLRRVPVENRINHTKESLRDRVLQLTGGRGADVIFDPVGGDVFDQSMRAIAPRGRILVVGFTSGRPATVPTNLILVKTISVIGVQAGLMIEQTGSEAWEDYLEMIRWIEDGRLNPQATEVIRFRDAFAGYMRIVRREHGSKIVVEIGSNS